jgi:hypothetical protein
MSEVRISLAISEVCKKLGVDYKSKNDAKLPFVKDAKRLGEIFIDLHIISGELKCISERWNVPEIHKALEDDIVLLENVDHDICKLAYKIKSQYEKDEKRKEKRNVRSKTI